MVYEKATSDKWKIRKLRKKRKITKLEDHKTKCKKIEKV